MNIGFSERVCQRFGDLLPSLPMVNLHGDAHLEQYAVTDDYFGLADFDDASWGPAVLDLVRFGASLKLAAQLHEWDPGESDVDALLDGYLEALNNPEIVRTAPPFVEFARRLRPDRSHFLRASEALMREATPAQQGDFERGYARYVELMLEEHPELDEGFFSPRRFGRLEMGFGSALEPKFLVRVEGATADPLDDIILEGKQVRDLSAISCVETGPPADAGRVVINQSRFSRLGGKFLAQVPRGPEESPEDPAFWVQQWSPSYVELDAESDMQTPLVMSEVARDVGRQLGVGHTRFIASPLDAQFRRQVRKFVEANRERIVREIDEMTHEVLISWEVYRDDTR